ncbi:hypothetical protein DFI02_11621 [Rhizobium sp. PP-F2F-G20b]|nr:hypothetical protein DFI02_11621 [Rhizobium sp. PP-F2F-G20b]
MARRLSEKDYNLLDLFLAYVLDAYKSGDKEKSQAIGDIAHLCAALDLGKDGDDPRAYMTAVMKETE